MNNVFSKNTIFSKHLVSEPNYQTAKFISENKLATEPQIFINKPVYLGLSILEISKIIMNQFWYDYIKRKYG